MDFAHDLASFVSEFNQKIEQDYLQIRKRVSEDPGTAGDQAEETWAQLLKKWLPSSYHVVTKGRVLGMSGQASPQLDIVVLSPSYPVGLMEKKLYVASGVVAAFECKLTLRPEHLPKVFENRIKINSATKREWEERRNLARADDRDYAYEEYHGLFEYGLLSHSHTGFAGDSIESVSGRIRGIDRAQVARLPDMLDLVCIRDLGCWTGVRAPFSIGYRNNPSDGSLEIFSLPHPQSGYDVLHGGKWAAGSDMHKDFSPIGAFIARFWTKLSRRDSRLREISRYFSGTLSAGVSAGMERVWTELQTPPSLWDRYVNKGVAGSAEEATKVYYEVGFHAV
ncbi:MAG: DUF6602 domain-containing protein [Hyphomonas sp.]